MAIEPKTAPDPKTTQSVFLDRIFKILCWIVGLIAVFCVLLFIYDFLGYDDAWHAFKSINPANAEAAEAEKLKALKIEAFRNFLLSIGALGAVVIGLVGLVLAIVRTHALDSQAKTAVKDSKLSEQKHQSEAFAKAIELLGNEDSFAVRLGAVYALEALARSSEELHGPIFETLCAYVREKAPAKDVPDLKPADNIETPDAVVVQAILTVAGRRDPKRDPEGFRLDLRNTNLRRADMRDGHFEGADFTDARLEYADLSYAHLEGAILMGAHLEHANLSYAHLEGAFLLGINFDSWTRVDGANFQGARNTPKAWDRGDDDNESD